jgi:outer membrane lipoprotein-sorting protein
MKKIVALFSFAALLVAMGSVFAQGQSAEDILAKVIEAQGGKEALEKIEDRTLSGTMDMVQMGTTASVSMYQKRPDKMRMEFEMMGNMMTQAYDGKTAWGVNPGTGQAQEMPDEAAKSIRRQAVGNDAFLHPDKYGVTYEYKGTEKVKDKDCHVLQQVFDDGYKVSLFVDSETFLPVKSQATDTNQMGVEVLSETYYGEYKKVEGVPVSHKISIFQDGQEFMHINIVDVEFNSGLEDSFFKMN